MESSPPTATLDSQTPPLNETETPPSDGPPLLLDCPQQPTFVDPQAAICWSANLQPQIKSTFKMVSLIGRGSGESFQLAFHGPGFWWSSPARASRWWHRPERSDDGRARGCQHPCNRPTTAKSRSRQAVIASLMSMSEG